MISFVIFAAHTNSTFYARAMRSDAGRSVLVYGGMPVTSARFGCNRNVR
jgi:hypothetical protein